jgi:protein-tyrosine phosphatase
MKHGLLFRSAGPASFTGDHRAALAQIGIQLVCDLRSDQERVGSSHEWESTVSIINLNLADDFGGEAALGRKIVRDDPSERGARTAMRTSYASMPAAMRPHLASLVTKIEEGATPLLVHCTAGKDRTGVLIALLLSMVGVPRESIIADYLLSEEYARHLHTRGDIVEAFSRLYGIPLEAGTVDAIIGVHPEYILSSIAQIEAEWGSIESYFLSIGISLSQQERLRLLLTENPD